MPSSADERETFRLEEKKGERSNWDEVSPPSGNKTLRDEVGPPPMSTPFERREQATRLQDDLILAQAERVASRSTQSGEGEYSEHNTMSRTRSRRAEAVDEFNEATNPLHEKAAVYKPPENPNTKLSAFVKKIHQSSFIVRYLTYIMPMVLILLVPLLIGSLKYSNSSVGGVELMWFSIWLEIVWLTLWAGRVVAKCLPSVAGTLASIFTNNAKKWRDMVRQLEIHLTLFLWWLAVEISFLPTMKNHHVDGDKTTRSWENTLNKIIIVVLVWTILNLIEKVIIQLIAISFHQRTYADRIEINKFQIGSLTKLYQWSRAQIDDKDKVFEENHDQQTSRKNPLQYATMAGRAASKVGNKVGDVANGVVADFTGRQAKSSSDPYQAILTLLRSTSGCQVLARRLYRTFVRDGDGFDTVFSGDLKEAFDSNEEAEAAFAMFDRDMNGDISIEELKAVCVDIGRERKSLTASLKDLDSVVSKLDEVFVFFVFVISLIVFLSLISTSAAGVLTSAGSTILALSWMFSTTATEFLQSIIFVFVKHPFDVGDRVTIYGNSGDVGLGDDYFVKEITLLYTEFKKMQGHVVQAPNSYLNTLFILNQRRSGGLSDPVPIVIKYGTTIKQMEALRQRLLEFVRSEKRDYQSNILTELREVTENLSVTLNVIFFYKSNWQNEGLRLLRRNKFICMLMIALQEIGIEGPRMNLQGYTSDTPFHVHYDNQPPRVFKPKHEKNWEAEIPIGGPSHAVPENIGTSAVGPAGTHSILRKGMDSVAGRARSQSASRKHIDFSLGMSDFSGDVMGDVFEDHSAHINDVVRDTNRETAERRMQEISEDGKDRHSDGTSRHRRPSNHSSPSQDSRPSVDAPSIHSSASSTRNRFFRHHRSISPHCEDLESGHTVCPDAPTAAGCSNAKD
ncbi:unnamed protein product [Penicillium egyptiacum]|uniref:EF-hand domain-containing protein n=1 Tax=Penicillium egyptiacum TaxID=1303716 RepID=A0A9W4P1K4_9EURO|nr:unnamed protein product [Penicillium egyptiacum]